MIVDIETRRLRTIGQLRAFVEGNEAVDFQPRDRNEAYGFVRDTLERFGCRRLVIDRCRESGLQSICSLATVEVSFGWLSDGMVGAQR